MSHVGDERSQPWFWIRPAAMRALREGLVDADPGLSQVRSVYAAIIEVANDERARTDQRASESATFSATRREIAFRAGTSTKTVDRATEALERIGLLRVERTRIEGDRNLPNSYILRDPDPGDSQSPTRDSESGTLGDSQSRKSPRSPKPQEPPNGPPAGEAEGIHSVYVNAMGKRGRGTALHADERKILRDALAAGDAAELKTCILACARSDYHMKRGTYEKRKGGKYNSLGHIFKPRTTKGQTWRSRIEWWLDRAAEQEQGAPPRFDVNEEAERLMAAQGLG